jgi:hypothetical protein
MVSFVGFIGIGVFGGGDSVSGKEVAGRYFLGSHGQFAEVSKMFFIFDLILAYWVFVNFPIFLLWTIWATRRWRRESP